MDLLALAAPLSVPADQLLPKQVPVGDDGGHFVQLAVAQGQGGKGRLPLQPAPS